MNFYVANDYIICEPYELENKSSTSSFLSFISESDNCLGKVVATDTLCIGDIVFYNREKSKEYTLGEKQYIVIHKNDVYAVVGGIE